MNSPENLEFWSSMRYSFMLNPSTGNFKTVFINIYSRQSCVLSDL